MNVEIRDTFKDAPKEFTFSNNGITILCEKLMHDPGAHEVSITNPRIVNGSQTLHSIRDALRRGRDVILAPDVQGASTVRWKLPNAISIFLRPPSLDELAPRLAARGTETTEERHIRLATAEREMQRVSEYDYVIVNHRDRLDQAVGDLKAIIVAERLRVCPRTVTL